MKRPERKKCNHNPLSEKTSLVPIIKSRKQIANGENCEAICCVCGKNFQHNIDLIV